MMHIRITLCALILALAVGCGGGKPGSGDGKDVKGITPTDAAKQEGKPVTIDMKVGFVYAHKDGLVLAEEDIAGKDFTGVSIFIPNEKVESFGSKNPSEVGDKYEGKKIKVSGKVAKKSLEYMADGKPARVERPVIEVTEPGQIKE